MSAAGVRLAELLRDVPFTPLCWQTAQGYSEVVLYAADALLLPYGFATSFVRTGTRQRGLPRAVDSAVAWMARHEPDPTRADSRRRRKADPRTGDRA